MPKKISQVTLASISQTQAFVCLVCNSTLLLPMSRRFRLMHISLLMVLMGHTRRISAFARGLGSSQHPHVFLSGGSWSHSKRKDSSRFSPDCCQSHIFLFHPQPPDSPGTSHGLLQSPWFPIFHTLSEHHPYSLSLSLISSIPAPGIYNSWVPPRSIWSTSQTVAESATWTFHPVHKRYEVRKL